VGNLKGRVGRLEGGRKGRGYPVIVVGPKESKEEAVQRHLAQNPEDEKAEVKIIINLSELGQDSPGAPPPPRPEPKYNAQAPGPGPLQITR
jgi:hypothetical protein